MNPVPEGCGIVDLVGPATQHLIRRLAPTNRPILLLGEPGTGKTRLAEQIHRLSGRSGPFVDVSAAGIPDHLENSILTGHARGAFTGALDANGGLIESAAGGTFFLDELDVASDRIQQILLYLLDGRGFRRFGEANIRHTDARFLFATNADLDQLITSGEFRRDLLDRIGYARVVLPPLRERQHLILSLARHFVSKEATALGKPVPVISGAVQQILVTNHWKGNIRQLQDVCEIAVSLTRDPAVIEPCDLPPYFVESCGLLALASYEVSAKARVAAMIEQTKGNKAEAARRLDMSRTHLYRLLTK